MRGSCYLISLFLISGALAGCLDSYLDEDGDGVNNDIDNCHSASNPEQNNTDGDEFGDECDFDDDNDGIFDTEDRFPLDGDEWSDIDKDGTGDNADLDDDGDSWEDSEEISCLTDPLDVNSTPTDTDLDGICDSIDSDDDGDNWEDSIDAFPLDNLEHRDTDGDGIGDNSDMDDDGDSWSDIDEIACLTDSLDSTSVPQDTDDDLVCDIVDTDDDGDGTADISDLFPLDRCADSDFDGDGMPDELTGLEYVNGVYVSCISSLVEDQDDDNDGVLDSIDVNDFSDTGVVITIETFQSIEYMDYFDNYAEIYICLHMDWDLFGCSPSTGHWVMLTGTTYSINQSFFLDLPETSRFHSFQLRAWDADSWEDDLMDINPDPNWNSYLFTYDSVLGTIDNSTSASGEGDGQGWDGALTFSYEGVDLRQQRITTFYWDYEYNSFELEVILDYDIYSYFKGLDHTANGIYDVESYAKFATPGEQYILDLANSLENLAIQSGFTTDLEKLEFLHAFVGAIEYELDIDGIGQNDYPKYPIEMLWHASGDCEDAAALYVSLAEAMGYDAMFMVGLVKPSDDEDWGGHAWAVVHVPNHSGAGWYGTGSKEGVPFYFVEATAWFDGSSGVGVNPWYEISDESAYDVE